MGALKDIGSRWIFCTWPRGTPSVIGFPPLVMVMVSSSLALAYVGSNRRTVFLSYRGHFPLGPYVERLGEGVPNLAWNLYCQASEGDPRQRVRINVGVIFRIGGVKPWKLGNGDGIKEDFTCLLPSVPRTVRPEFAHQCDRVLHS